jgi:hypothetical protein
MKVVRSLLFLFLYLQAPLWATQIPGTITVMNDSPYILTASVYANSGEYLGQATLQPGEQKNFTTNLSSTNLNRPGHPDVSITPYRIIWTCAKGEVYSMTMEGSVGSYIRATTCPGQHLCSPSKEEKAKEQTGKK